MRGNSTVTGYWTCLLTAMKNRLTAVRAVLVCSLLICSTSVAVADLGLGRQEFAVVDAFPLRMSVSASPTFFARVGGVAFSEEAIGENGHIVVGLSYHPNRPDGSRLRVRVRDRNGGEQTATASIHDWALVPIAKYAASEYDSAFTIFGQPEDVRNSVDRPAVEDAIMNGGRLVQYHEAFENELVGLRMFQADTLLITEDSNDVFRVNGTPVLGRGETGPSLARNSARFNRVQQRIDALTSDGGYAEIWTAPRTGSQIHSWAMRLDASETVVARALADSIDIDLVATINGRAIDEDTLLDSEPIVEVSGVTGTVTFTLRAPAGTEAGMPVMIEAIRSRNSQRTWVMPETRRGTFTWTIDADPKRAYTVAAESPDGHDIDLKVRRGETVLMEDVALGAYPVIVFGDTGGEVTVELTVPQTMRPGDKVVIAQSDTANVGYQSYVVTDGGKRGREYQTTFRIDGGELAFRGEPYWQMWRYSVRYQHQLLIASASGFEPGEADESDIIIDRPLSAAVSDAIRENEGVNPTVYEALRQTMRYTALFRHFKARDPLGFSVFVNSLDNVRTTPMQPANYKIETPNLWIPQ